MTTSLISDRLVLLDRDDAGVGHLRLNRPDASNGMNIEFLQDFHDALVLINRTPEIRSVVITGEGKNFCAGGDVKTFAQQGESLPAYLREATDWLQKCSQSVRQLDAPVIAAVHGFAAGGGGFGLVCAADLVVAAESAKFMTGATRVAMVPDFGTTALLPQLVGMRAAMELVLTNRVLSASEAKELGIINEVIADAELLPRAFGLATAIAEGSFAANAAAKHLMWEGIGSAIDTQLAIEARTVSALGGTADAREGLAAVIERRPPTFDR